jgi:hypothetical protein
MNTANEELVIERFIRACNDNDIEALESLDYSLVFIYGLGSDPHDPLRNACKKGSVDVVRFIMKLDHDNTGITLQFNLGRLLFEACHNNQLEMAKYLMTLEPLYGQIDLRVLNFTINEMCRLGYNEIVMYLCSFKDSHMLLRDDYLNSIFQTFVLRGIRTTIDLDLVKYFVSLDEQHNRIRIHEDDEFVLRVVCEKGYIALIKYLFTLEPIYGDFDIHAVNDSTFKLPKRNKLAIQKMLYKKDPNYPWHAVVPISYCEFRNGLDDMIEIFITLHKYLVCINSWLVDPNVLTIVEKYAW